MPDALSDLVANPVAWMMVVYVVLQVYACIVLARGTGYRAARGALIGLFGLNAAYAAGQVILLVPGHAWPSLSWSGFADDLTNGFLVASAELSAAALLRRRPVAAAWPVALVVSLGPLLLRLTGTPMPATFTLAAYAYAALRLAWAGLHVDGRPEAAWTAWLLAAFAPRFVEFAAPSAWPLSDPWAPATEATLLLLGLGLLGCIAASLRAELAAHRIVVGVALAAGVLLSILRTASMTAPLVVSNFTLDVLRPAFVLGGAAASGLLGARSSPESLSRTALLAVGTAATFEASLAAFSAAGGVPLVAQLLLAAAIAVVSLVVWAPVSERVAAAVTQGVEGVTLGDGASNGPCPGLDPACKFGPDWVAEYGVLAARASRLPPAQRARVAALTRGHRVLLALRGSSLATLGQARYSQAGLQFATHIPYRYLATVIKGLNAAAEPAKLVETSTGRRGVRHYWLTQAGREEAERLATQLGPESGEWPLGERFYELRPARKRVDQTGDGRTPEPTG